VILRKKTITETSDKTEVCRKTKMNLKSACRHSTTLTLTQRNTALKLKLCAVIALSFLVLSSGTAQTTAPNAGQRSNQQARAVLDAGIEATGGLEALRSVHDFTLREIGRQHHPYQSLSTERPWLSGPVEELTVVDSTRGLAFNEVKQFNPGFTFWTGTVIKGGVGFRLDFWSKTATSIPKPSLDALRTQCRRLPHFLLLELLDQAASLRWLGQDTLRNRKQNVIAAMRPDGRLLNLYFDAQTNLLTKYDYIYEDAAVGDSLIEQSYQDYRSVGPVKVPRGRTLSSSGEVREETNYVDVKFNASPAESLFDVPSGFEKTAEPAVSSVVGVSTLAKDVYLVQGMNGDYNGFFIAFNDYVLVVDAPEPFPFNHFSEKLIEKIKQTVPGRPIKYLVLSHYHWDHAGGARAFMAEGTTVVTTPGNKGFLEQLARARFTLDPDALARNPRVPVIETIQNQKRVFRDENHLVEFYDIGPSPHANEMIVAYLPREKILFQADLLNPNPDGRLPTAQDRTVHFAARIQQLGLDPEKIVGAHGRVVSRAELAEMLEKRQRETAPLAGEKH